MDHRRLLDEPEQKGAEYARFQAAGPSTAPAAGTVIVPSEESKLKRAPSEIAAEMRGAHPMGPVNGLTSAEAEARLRQYGLNAIEEKVDGLAMQLFKHFIHGPMQYMILIAAIISVALQDYADFGVLVFLLAANGGLSFYEARKAGNAVAALKNSLAPMCRCYRDGRLTELEAKFLVPGDKVMVKLGDIIPADSKLLDGEPVTVDESALTGESLPATRYPGQDILAGSVMKTGEIDAIVEKTGKDSFLGKSADLVAKVQQISHFQKVVYGNAFALCIAAAICVIIILGVQLGRGVKFVEVLQLCIIVLVAAIPITLPVVATSTLAVGARKLAADNCIVSRLAAIEEMAGMDILCSDKTGTLTKNQLTVEEPYALPGVDVGELYLAAGLASKREHSDAIDSAVLSKIPNASVFDEFVTEKFIPFDPVSKRTQARIRDRSGKTFWVAKGAPQVLFKLGDEPQIQPEPIQRQINEWVERLASRGLRPLGVCRTDADGKWIYLGLISLFDPPRDDTRSTIERALEMGCDVKMVTGDHLLIGIETARMLGMGSKFYGQSFFKEVENKPQSWISEIVENADGFAQVYPEHKYFIVEALQKAGHLTGMTGDGVNDAPALKKADCGIAVQGATDAARAAADIILLSPGLSSIITAMIRSRKIFQRLKNYVIYRMNATTQILLFVFIGVLFLHDFLAEDGLQIPAVVLVLITLVNDGTTLAIAYDKVIPSPKPEKWYMTRLVIIALAVGIVGTIECYLCYFFAINRVFLFSDSQFPGLSHADYNYNYKPPGATGLIDPTSVDAPCSEKYTKMQFTGDWSPITGSVGTSYVGTNNGIVTCTRLVTQLRGVAFVALAIGGQFSVYVCRTHSFFFSRRPGFALLTASSGGILLLWILGSFWPEGAADLSGIGPRNAIVIVGFLVLTFIAKDIVKVTVYFLIAVSPFNFDEKRARREMMRKINLYGTADDNAVARLKSTRKR